MSLPHPSSLRRALDGHLRPIRFLLRRSGQSTADDLRTSQSEKQGHDRHANGHGFLRHQYRIIARNADLWMDPERRELYFRLVVRWTVVDYWRCAHCC